ncbi:MAG: EI24 domain-containing protein [Planctomycetota bacterium]|nr:EI24 domain-containing protein [Planctomycetota bacterium]MDA1142206.1 EI24 domain-containing protein [Planctomycetota bacterium]
MAPRFLSPFHQVLFGAAAPLRGLAILKSNFRQLGGLCVLPVIITLITLGFVIAGVVHGISNIDISALAGNWIPSFLAGIVNFIGKLLLIVVLFLFSYLIFTPIGLALATPINDVISARTEKILLGKNYGPLPGLTIWKGLLHTCQHLTITLSIGIPLAILAITPFINIAFVWFNILFALLVLSLELVDIPLSKRVFRYFQKWAYLKNHFFYFLGFGAVCFLMMTIPIVNLALMPLNIIGGTWLYLKMEGKLDPSPGQLESGGSREPWGGE